MVAVAFFTAKKYIFFKSNNSIAKLSCTKNGKCRVELKNGKVFQAKIVSAEWLFNYFAVFVLENNVNKFKTTIAKDALSQEQFYSLRLYLRSLNNLR